MKIRIKGNSVRYRLAKTEVSILCTTGHIAAKTTFGSSTFVYSITSSDINDELKASYQNNEIQIAVPKSWLIGWADDDRIGFQAIQQIDNDHSLQILVEKDFTCLEERGEDESDLYPNPKAL